MLPTPRRSAIAIAAVLSAILIVSIPGFADSKTALRIEDLFALEVIVGLELSPDGSQVIYSVKEASLKDNRYITTLWRVSTESQEQPMPLTEGDKDYSPKWSPDGKAVAFLSTRSGKPQLWLLTLADSQLKRLTDRPVGVTSFGWSPIGQNLAFTAPEETAKSSAEVHENDRNGYVVEARTFGFNSLFHIWRHDDRRGRYSRLWMLDLESGQYEELIKDLDVLDFAWSPEGRSLAFTTRVFASTDSETDAPNLGSDIRIYSVAERRSQLILRGNSGNYPGDYDHSKSYSRPLWSPDGHRLAIVYKDWKNHFFSSEQVGIYRPATGGMTLLKPEQSVELYEPQLQWTPLELYLVNTLRAERQLFALSERDGATRPVFDSDGYNSNYSFSADGTKVAFVHQTLQQPPEIYVSKIGLRNIRKLTSINRYFDQVRLPVTERLRWTSPDGQQAEGWLFKPPNFEHGKKYPLLVMLHGGPRGLEPDRFEPYGSDITNWDWPYPFRLLPIAVLLSLFPITAVQDRMIGNHLASFWISLKSRRKMLFPVFRS